MNGVHDMGGMDGFGKVEVEKNEPSFHEPWEGRVLAMNRAMGATGACNIDMGRHARERICAGSLSRPRATTRNGTSGCATCWSSAASSTPTK